MVLSNPKYKTEPYSEKVKDDLFFDIEKFIDKSNLESLHGSINFYKLEFALHDRYSWYEKGGKVFDKIVGEYELNINEEDILPESGLIDEIRALLRESTKSHNNTREKLLAENKKAPSVKRFAYNPKIDPYYVYECKEEEYLGYDTYAKTDEIDGCKQGKKVTKILSQRDVNKNHIKQFNQFKSMRDSAKQGKNLKVVITNNPLDILRKSETQWWQSRSCENLSGGCFGQGPYDDVKLNNALVYLTSGKDQKWIARFMLRWCELDSATKPIDVGIETTIYGNKQLGEYAVEKTAAILKKNGLLSYESDGVCVTPYVFDGYSDQLRRISDDLNSAGILDTVSGRDAPIPYGDYDAIYNYVENNIDDFSSLIKSEYAIEKRCTAYVMATNEEDAEYQYDEDDYIDWDCNFDGAYRV